MELEPVGEGQKILDLWSHIVSAAVVYDPRTHGILRAPLQANGLRTAPDRLAPLAEVMKHRRDIYRAGLPVWQRAAGLVVPSLVEPPLLNREAFN